MTEKYEFTLDRVIIHPDRALARIKELEAALSTDAEAVAIYKGNGLVDCGDSGHHNIELLKLIPANTPLYAEPVKTAPAVAVKALTADDILAGIKDQRFGYVVLDGKLTVGTDRRIGIDLKELAAFLSRSALSAQVQDVATFQQRVEAAHHALFHDDQTDIAERNARCFKESIETAQAFGMNEDDAIALVRYTFSRPVGEPAKEIGAKVLTAFSLSALLRTLT